jgi:hypothetical protein
MNSSAIEERVVKRQAGVGSVCVWLRLRVCGIAEMCVGVGVCACVSVCVCLWIQISTYKRTVCGRRRRSTNGAGDKTCVCMCVCVRVCVRVRAHLRVCVYSE